jgi:quinone-modifying oxidoreductase subunit QmoB
MIKAVEAHPNITVKTETVVARLAGQPGEFTVTFKKPGEKIAFDVPYPLPDEMKVDESGKELNAEQQFEAYQKYNEGRVDILKLDPSGELYGAVILAAGWIPASVEKEAYRPPRLRSVRMWSPTPIRNHCQGRQNSPSFRRQGSQISGFYSKPG